MAAATQDQQRPKWALPESAPNEAHTILATKICYEGAVAMLVSGKAQPLVAATASSTLLGVGLRNRAAGASDLVLADGDPAVFLRGCFPFLPNPSDTPTESKIGQTVYFADDNTIQATAPGAPNLGGTLRAIIDGQYWVEF